VTVTYTDDRIDVFPKVGGMTRGPEVIDGVLHLRYQNGEMAPLEHVASLPLTNIRKWEMQPS
jgi:hypothetical protein